MQKTMWMWLAVAAAFVFAPVARVDAQDGPSMVILVRHAEKAAVPGNDPPLSEAGQARAKALADSVAKLGIASIIVTPYKRTMETAAVVAGIRNLTPEVMPLDAGAAAHIAAVATAVKAKKGVVLVVGHSNTIPAIVGALGGPKLPDICDASYATMYVLRMTPGGAPTLTVGTYGAPDPAGATTCAGMK